MKTLAGLGITHCLFCYFPSRLALINRFRLDYRSEERYFFLLSSDGLLFNGRTKEMKSECLEGRVM